MCPSCNPIVTKVKVFRGLEVCMDCGRELDKADFVVISKGQPPRQPNNSFGRGVRRDRRGIAYLSSDGTPLRMGESFDPRKYGEGSVRIIN